MSPQARAKLPPELGRLTRKDMEAVIYQPILAGKMRRSHSSISWTRSRKWTLQQNCILAAPRYSDACRRSWRG